MSAVIAVMPGGYAMSWSCVRIRRGVQDEARVFGSGRGTTDQVTEETAAYDYDFSYHAQIAAMTPLQRQRLRDKERTAVQAPISGAKRCVLYRKDGIEKRTPWFYTAERASRALAIMQARYGAAVLYRD